jgi:hypothetical protein
MLNGRRKKLFGRRIKLNGGRKKLFGRRIKLNGSSKFKDGSSIFQFGCPIFQFPSSIFQLGPSILEFETSIFKKALPPGCIPWIDDRTVVFNESKRHCAPEAGRVLNPCNKEPLPPRATPLFYPDFQTHWPFGIPEALGYDLSLVRLRYLGAG